ncbi:MAG: hypothetical protein U0271_15015 [Polyangiaceae bacterium]
MNRTIDRVMKGRLSVDWGQIRVCTELEERPHYVRVAVLDRTGQWGVAKAQVH